MWMYRFTTNVSHCSIQRGRQSWCSLCTAESFHSSCASVCRCAKVWNTTRKVQQNPQRCELLNKSFRFSLGGKVEPLKQRGWVAFFKMLFLRAIAISRHRIWKHFLCGSLFSAMRKTNNWTGNILPDCGFSIRSDHDAKAHRWWKCHQNTTVKEGKKRGRRVRRERKKINIIHPAIDIVCIKYHHPPPPPPFRRLCTRASERE